MSHFKYSTFMIVFVFLITDQWWDVKPLKWINMQHKTQSRSHPLESVLLFCIFCYIEVEQISAYQIYHIYWGNSSNHTDSKENNSKRSPSKRNPRTALQLRWIPIYINWTAFPRADRTFKEDSKDTQARCRVDWIRNSCFYQSLSRLLQHHRPDETSSDKKPFN